MNAKADVELCGDEHHRDGDNHSLRCNRPIEPQQDDRRHRGDHWYRDDTFGWSWPNPKQKASS